MLTKQGLVWLTDGSKPEKGVGAAAWRQGSGHEVVCSLDIPFSRLRLGPLWSVPKLCWRETAGKCLY